MFKPTDTSVSADRHKPLTTPTKAIRKKGGCDALSAPLEEAKQGKRQAGRRRRGTDDAPLCTNSYYLRTID
ncbi:hypothetical protein ACMYZ5_03255 [Bacteroides sp. KG68]|uniref:hypothetical protein n=1 Tax=unclassified Bacteroides TaxID=2646097 RepID=UPI003D9934E6